MPYFRCNVCGATSLWEHHSRNVLNPNDECIVRLCTYCGAEEHYLPVVDGLVMIRYACKLKKVVIMLTDNRGDVIMAQALSPTRARNLGVAMHKMVKDIKKRKGRKK